MADLSLNVAANTASAQASIGQLATLTEAQMKRIASFVRAATDEQAKMARTVKDAANSDSYQKIADGAHKVQGAHAGVNRELLVLGHEISQGNYSRFGGSLLVLAERTNFLSFALSGTGAVVSVLGAALLGTVSLMAMGAIEGAKFAKSLQLTGNFAAVTSEQLRGMADAQAKQTGQTGGGARGSLEAVAGSGLFSQAEVAIAARAMGDYQRMTGETAADALKKFQSIQDGVARWAAEENKSVHFLTLAEYEHIKALEDSGDKEGAAIEAMKAYASAIESRGEPSLGILARAWHAVADAASRAGQAIMDVGRPQDALSASLAAIDQQIALVKQANTGNPGAAADYLANLSAERERVAKLQFHENERRAMVATNAATQQAAIDGRAYEEGILRQAHAMSERTKELAKWKAQRDKDAAAGSPMSDTDYKAGVAEINHRYSKQPGSAQANEYRSLDATIKAFNTTTEEEAARLAKVTEGQKFLTQIQEALQKSGEKLTSGQKASIMADAQKAAALRDIADQEIKAQAASLARIRADTANQEAQQSIVASVVQSGNDQANAILRQTAMIGKSAQDVLKTQDLQKFDDMVGKALLGADGETVKRINEVAAVIRNNLGNAIDDAKAKQDAFNASFANGFAKASEDYVKQANNNAEFAQKFFTDAVNGMSDSLANFAETGKLSWKSLIDSMINDLIRMELQKGFSNIFGNGAIGSLFDTKQGASGASGTGTALGLFSSSFGGSAFAGGIDSVPYNGMPAVLHEGERVMTRIENQQSRSSSGGHIFNFDMSGMSFGAGVDASGVAQAVRIGMQQTKAEIQRSLLTNGRMG